jgi:hypothetical protein
LNKFLLVFTIWLAQTKMEKFHPSGLQNLSKLIFLFFCYSIISYAQTTGLGVGNSRVQGRPFNGNPRTAGYRFDSFSGVDTAKFFTIPFYFYIVGGNISDQNGQVLFFTNGYTLGIPDSLIATNGDSLGCSPNEAQVDSNTYAYGNGFLNSMLILPQPGDSSRYQMIHTNPFYGNTDPLCYSCALKLFNSEVVIDSNGTVAITQKNQIVFSDTLAVGGMTATKHGNGRDWWIVVFPAYESYYHLLLLSPNGITHTIHSLPVPPCREYNTRFSPDGEKLALLGNLGNPNAYSLLDFDRCTGILGNPRLAFNFDQSYPPWGCCFSPDSRYIYTSNTFSIYRYDTQASNFSASRETIFYTNSFFLDTFAGNPTNLFTMYPSYDGRIYLNSTSTVNVYSWIENPNAPAAQVEFHYMEGFFRKLNNGTTTVHPNYHLGPKVGSACDTLGLTVGLNTNEPLEVSIFPNPGNGKLYLQYEPPRNKSGWLCIYDAAGKLHLKTELAQWTNQKELDLTSLAEGMYAFHFDIEGRTTTFKYLKRKF